MEAKPKRRENLVVEEMDDELLVADFTGSKLHTLNATAAVIWELCDGERTDRQIAEELAGYCGVPVSDVHGDVKETLAQFRDKGLLE